MNSSLVNSGAVFIQYGNSKHSESSYSVSASARPMRAHRDEAHLLQGVIDSTIEADQLTVCQFVDSYMMPPAALVGKELEGVDATAVAQTQTRSIVSPGGTCQMKGPSPIWP